MKCQADVWHFLFKESLNAEIFIRDNDHEIFKIEKLK